MRGLRRTVADLRETLDEFGETTDEARELLAARAENDPERGVWFPDTSLRPSRHYPHFRLSCSMAAVLTCYDIGATWLGTLTAQFLDKVCIVWRQRLGKAVAGGEDRGRR